MRPAALNTCGTIVANPAPTARNPNNATLDCGTSSAKLEQRGNTLLTAVFVVTYRAPKDGKLNLNWVTEAAFNSDCGGVALEAATLR